MLLRTKSTILLQIYIFDKCLNYFLMYHTSSTGHFSMISPLRTKLSLLNILLIDTKFLINLQKLNRSRGLLSVISPGINRLYHNHGQWPPTEITLPLTPKRSAMKTAHKRAQLIAFSTISGACLCLSGIIWFGGVHRREVITASHCRTR